MYRTDPEPNYWKDEKGKMKIRCYDLSEEKSNPKIVFKDFEVLYLDKDQIEKKKYIKIKYNQNQTNI